MKIENLSIQVECSAGADIEMACHEAIALANHLRCCVYFKFNEVTCMAFPGSDPGSLVKNFWEASRSKFTHKIATSR